MAKKTWHERRLRPPQTWRAPFAPSALTHWMILGGIAVRGSQGRSGRGDSTSALWPTSSVTFDRGPRPTSSHAFPWAMGDTYTLSRASTRLWASGLRLAFDHAYEHVLTVLDVVVAGDVGIPPDGQGAGIDLGRNWRRKLGVAAGTRVRYLAGHV